ncbi:MAG: 4'-phosphopantetheinyl transferase superfamily protein [Hungatella sp.]|jgi:4'-phosphopantetheinyl transferase|nr:4'-phosphopantetheinyl transferase superfamily protein [Hungatella sp.]
MVNISFREIEYQDYIIWNTFIPELEVEIYAIDVKGISKKPEEFQNKIPQERYRKMLRYHNYSDKMLLIGNEILFEYRMEHFFPEIKCEEWKRREDAFGKPYIEGEDQIYFNMSHAGTYSVCAFSNKPVGIDIERISPVDLLIAQRYYCISEFKDIMKYRGDDRIKRFYQYWVLKESFIKAVGKGLSIPLDKFSFHEGADNGLLYVNHQINENKYLSRQLPCFDRQYEMAVCIQVL